MKIILEGGNEKHIKLMLRILGIKDSVDQLVEKDFLIVDENENIVSDNSNINIQITMEGSSYKNQHTLNNITKIKELNLKPKHFENQNLNEQNILYSKEKNVGCPVYFELGSKISDLFHQFAELDMPIALAIYKNKKQSLVLGYVIKEKAIELLESIGDKMCLSKVHTSNSKSNSPADSKVNNELLDPDFEIFKAIGFQSLRKTHFSWQATICENLLTYSCFNDVSKDKIKDLIIKSHFCSVDLEHFSHPSFALKSSIPSSFLVLNNDRYLKISIKYKDGDSFCTLLPPFTLIDFSYLDLVRANVKQGVSDIPEYIPTVQLELSDSRYTASYYALKIEDCLSLFK
ncbi:MAG: hypothetical protein MHPSP_003121 [Paramarteilia canceri]